MHVAGIRGFPAPTGGNWYRQLYSACRHVDSGVVVHPERERVRPEPHGMRGGFSASERDDVGHGRLCTLVQARSDSLLRAPGPTRHTPVGPGYVPHAGDAPASAPDRERGSCAAALRVATRWKDSAVTPKAGNKVESNRIRVVIDYKKPQ